MFEVSGRFKKYVLISGIGRTGKPNAARAAHATAARHRKTILYFYQTCGFPDWQPHYNLYEYRFLEVLCKNYDVIVAFFARSWSKPPNRNIIPRSARFILLRDLPLPTSLPRVFGWPLDYVIRILRIALLTRILSPDVVYGNWVSRASGFCCGRAGIHPLVVAAWGSDVLIEVKESLVLRIFGKLTVRSADAIIVDSEVQRRAVLELGCDRSKVYCFPWGIDLDRFRPQDKAQMRRELRLHTSRIIISIRTHSSLYGVEYLIRAIPRILEEIRDVMFLIAGDGPLLEYHKSLARQLGIEQNVRFLGYVANKQLPRILNAAEIYVSTSFSDGSSASLMEALGCGLPVVVTDIPGNREWIAHGENGFLVSPGDTSALAVCIAKLLQDDALRLRIKRANLNLAKAKADWKTNSLVLEKCIEHLIL